MVQVAGALAGRSGELGAHWGRRPVQVGERPKLAAIEIAVDVAALERLDWPVIDIAANNCAAVGIAVIISENRRGKASGRVCGIDAVGGRTFVKGPTVICARGDGVNLLPRVLADIADDELSSGRIEAGAKGIAETIGPDLGCPGIVNPAKGVACGDRVVPPGIVWNVVAVDVDAQDLAEQAPGILCQSCVFAVAHRRIKETVRAEA